MPDMVLIRNAIASALLWGIVGTGLLVLRRREAPKIARQRAVSTFLALVVGVGCVVGFTQRVSLFPFHTWILLGGRASQSGLVHEIVGVDSAGTEYRIDYRAWQPLSYYELFSWIYLEFPDLRPIQQRRVAAHLLNRVESARSKARHGEPIGTFDRYLGPLALPLFLTYDAIWEDPSRVPPTAFTGLRWYERRWDVDRRARDADAVSHELLYQYIP